MKKSAIDFCHKAGTLYIVATPIGNLKDISLRALEILKFVDLIAAEDTRQSKKLLNHYGIQTPLMSLHEHNEEIRSKLILEKLQNNQNIALISDAGTPLISDPGYHLVEMAHAATITIVPIPGTCALIAALSASGLPTDRFVFEGFLPAKTSHRKQRLKELLHETRTLIFYESTHRILDSVADMTEVFGSNRKATLARELTKLYETIKTGNLKELYEIIQNNPEQQKGEFVILVHGAEEARSSTENLEVQRVLQILTEELPGSQAVAIATKLFDGKVSKKTLYDLMLKNRQSH